MCNYASETLLVFSNIENQHFWHSQILSVHEGNYVGSVGAVSEAQILKIPLCVFQGLERVGQSGTGQPGEPSAWERSSKPHTGLSMTVMSCLILILAEVYNQGCHKWHRKFSSISMTWETPRKSVPGVKFSRIPLMTPSCHPNTHPRAPSSS